MVRVPIAATERLPGEDAYNIMEALIHDFRAPLTAVVGYARLISRQTYATKDGIPCHEHILRCGHILTDLVNDTWDLLRNAPIELHSTTLGNVVQPVVDFFRTRLGEETQLIEDFTARDDKIVVDPTQLQRVVTNLLTNSLGALPNRQGTIYIRTRLVKARDSDGVDAKIVVSDSGVGIPPEDLPKIFDLHFSRHGDYGLGLYVVDQAVAKHRGRITIRSTPERGTTFIITIPARPRHE